VIAKTVCFIVFGGCRSAECQRIRRLYHHADGLRDKRESSLRWAVRSNARMPKKNKNKLTGYFIKGLNGKKSSRAEAAGYD
jgi:hypothetical protein